MKKLASLCLVMTLLLVTACSSNSDSGMSDSDTDSIPDANTLIRFDQLVTDIFEQTSDTSEPVSTNQLSIEFNNDDSNFSHLF